MGLPYLLSPTWKKQVSRVASMKLPAEYTRNMRMASPLIWPPKIMLVLKSMPAVRSEAPSCSYTRRTALPSTRVASNMLGAFQMVSGSSCGPRSIFSTCRISRTLWLMLRLPADSMTMKRSSARS